MGTGADRAKKKDSLNGKGLKPLRRKWGQAPDLKVGVSVEVLQFWLERCGVFLVVSGLLS